MILRRFEAFMDGVVMPLCMLMLMLCGLAAAAMFTWALVMFVQGVVVQ